jgi:hypothetical protein
MIRNFFMREFGYRQLTAGLLAALVVVLGSDRAEAELIISQTTVEPTGDPSVIFDFQLALGAGTYLSNDNTIEVLSVPDVVTSPPIFGPAYQYALGSPYNSYFGVNTTSNGDGTFDITLTYNASRTSAFDNSSGSSPLSIGDLYVLTTIDYPPGGPPPSSPVFDTLYYTSVATNSNGTADVLPSGSTTPSLVPEPASVSLIGLGLASAWLVARRRGKRGVSPLAS